MRALLLAIVAWASAQMVRFTGCLTIIGAVTIFGALVGLVWFGINLVGMYPTDAMSFTMATTTTAEPTATATAEPTATATAEPTATKAEAAKPKPTTVPAPATAVPTTVPVQPTAVPTAPPAEPTAPPAPTILVGDQGPCKGGTTNSHFLETREGLGNSGWLEYELNLAVGEVGLAWGSSIPGFGQGRSFVTIAGPWAGKIGIFNGAVRQGRVLTDLNQVQSFWGNVIDCDLQRALPIAEQRRGLYQQFRLNW